MDPLEFLEPEELLRFLHCNKTEMSCMEKPLIFLYKLRDYNLIPEDRFKKVSRMKKNMEEALYGILDWIEGTQSQHIKLFWKCAFKETVQNHNPTLKMLHRSLMDGSFHFDTQLPEKAEKEGRDEKESTEPSEDEERQENSVEKKRKLRSRSVCDAEDEQPGPSSRTSKKKSKKISFTSPLKKGERGDIWTWPIYKSQLPVICGNKEGMLQRDKLAKGQKCIMFNKQWFTPSEFEKLAGKSSCRNWKMSIRCENTPLGKLIKEGHLKSVSFKRRNIKAKKSLFSSKDLTTASEGEDEENDEESNQEDQDSSSDTEHVTEEAEGQNEQHLDANLSNTKVFKVTCGDLTGTLHKNRFASGKCGKSIRTDTSWMTPVEFLEASDLTDASWKKEIKWDGKPLSVLIEAKILEMDSLLCTCGLCEPDPKNLDNQKNDDECCICKNEEDEADLIMCDACPRSFHQKCHLPHVQDMILSDDNPWWCTFCVFRTNQVLFENLERDMVMSSPISKHMMHCQYLVLHLRNADEEQMFSTDPMRYLKNYPTVIKNPMWLGKVANKLQKNQYLTVGEFVSDVHLIFTNWATYNQNNVEILAMGDKLKQLFDSEFKKSFNILEQTEDI